ncbi:hypothetical protein SLE2022_235730 [Rubroshorea leprosula]
MSRTTLIRIEIHSYGVTVLCLCLQQLGSSKIGMFCPSQAFSGKPARTQMLGKKEKIIRLTCQATKVPADDRVPDMGKRQLMNLLLLGAVLLPTGFMLAPYASSFVPAGCKDRSKFINFGRTAASH